ncbi:MAG: DUF2147 domain-containing protein [Cyclobacteriaceae bacterium]|nr:DUF2147 domain-containing protein [Cyclobacteriaceae bacterium]
MITILLFCFTGLKATAQEQARDIVGQWFTEKGEAKISIYIESGLYVGKIIWVKDGKENAKLNTIVLSGFKYDQETREWNDGTVYDPRHGHKSSGYLVLKDSKTLKVVGYKAFRWISDTELWTRIEPNP